MADVWVVKASEVGMNEGHTHCKTHLGHLLSVGDSVLGYALILPPTSTKFPFAKILKYIN